MGRMYAISFNATAVTAAQDLFEVLAGTDKPFYVHSLHVSQSSDAGDSESEQLLVSVRRVTGAPTSGSGGSTATARPLMPSDTAAGVTAEVNNTTQLTGGTNVELHMAAFNVMAGLDVVWTPETRPYIADGTRVVVELETAPADSLTMSGTLYIEELG